MLDAEIIEARRREAEYECERCQGRRHGDCDPACRYWALTASEAERASVERRD